MANANTRALLAALSLTWLALAACSRQGQDEMSWARAALERNDRLEIVAADPQSRTFTVRSKDTGELHVVRADQLIAAPTAVAAASATAARASAAPAPAPAAATPANTAELNPARAAPAAAASAAADETAPTPAPEPRVFASRALQPGSPARPVPGQVLEAGPGYTIEAGSAPAAAPVREAGGTSAGVELRHEPIVCQGARLLHIDNRNLQFEGDAVSAEDGCEIHITNSRIRATGVGVSARAANVHIDNSLIEGDTASIDASDGAQIYTAASRFRGLSRRLDTAAVHDLGGNVWN
jgi:hypothetical protein